MDGLQGARGRPAGQRSFPKEGAQRPGRQAPRMTGIAQATWGCSEKEAAGAKEGEG